METQDPEHTLMRKATLFRELVIVVVVLGVLIILAALLWHIGLNNI
jgi:hypothetical protein